MIPYTARGIFMLADFHFAKTRVNHKNTAREFHLLLALLVLYNHEWLSVD
jgi:hypothetical protein